MTKWQATFLGLKHLPRELSGFEIEAFFTFTLAERQLIEERRRPALKLGLALQIGFLRMSGRLLDSVRIVPPALWRHLGVDFRSRCPIRPKLMSNSSCALRFRPFPRARSIERADILAANWPAAAPTTEGSPERLLQAGPLVDLAGWRRISGPMRPYDRPATRRARSKVRLRALSDS